MKVFLCFLVPILISGFIGMHLDINMKTSAKQAYWALGVFGAFVGFVAFIITR